MDSRGVSELMGFDGRTVFLTDHVSEHEGDFFCSPFRLILVDFYGYCGVVIV
jgi:hypothetical protein